MKENSEKNKAAWPKSRQPNTRIHMWNWFTWIQHISGGNVEEHVDFHNVKIASLGFNKFRGGDVDENGDFQRLQLRSLGFKNPPLDPL